MTFDFYAIAKLALYLECLFQRGEGDEDTADGIRDDMDRYYNKLTEKEVDVLERLIVLLSELETK